ncbi:N-acetylmuramoyl-L-alanine amidase [Edaphobacter bradus]|uniref:N-acetylmuramoyl-L-alanine amidase n=1 Tax=Edaphobacter bradus TaxID=2259016 RepID=UPI0021E0CA00|nr:N-acetylmuramoyl-L-alanine amidase [Edaphobacter bradus]
MLVCKKLRGPRLSTAGAAALRCGFVVVVCCEIAIAPNFVEAKPRAAVQKHVVEASPWEKATQGREALEAIPEANRTKADYARALDGFRAIYHDAPQSQYAAPAVNTVAELLAEQGRTLHDPKSLKAAVGQYEFLRTQYPGSSLRVAALLAEAQIYENDLHDTAAAHERYSLFLKQYPHSSLAEEARAGLDSLKPGAIHRTQSAAAEAVVPWHATLIAPAHATSATTDDRPGTSAPVNEALNAGPETGTDTSTDAAQKSQPQPESTGLSHIAKTSAKRHRLAQVTGIRHWSTPNYTRVAIDLGDDVTYEAARVPNPDRIYFDLHGTRLAQELVGHSFTVTDDGFLKRIRAAQFSNDMTRVVLDVNDVTEYSAFLLPNPYRLIIDIHGGAQPQNSASKTQPADILSTRPVPNTVATRNANTTTEVAAISDQPGKVEATSVPTSQPIAAVVPGSGAPAANTTDVNTSSRTTASSRSTSHRGKKTEPAEPARAASPTADGQTSLVRALGLKIGRIVIDAGHGGHDSGTIGADGIEEKDVVLDVALRLGKLLHDRLGSEIIYTRSDDTFIPLETRTAIANKAQADLFLSIHANSSSDPTARGVETYYLNFTSQPDALEVAARENAVSDQSIHQLSDLVKKIALKDKIDESREFASDVETSLYSGLQKGNSGLKNRGVKKAPFVVLIGANMPSILAEISFVTNPKDASQLRQPEYRERVAESLYKGVARYEGGLSGSKVPTERASTRTAQSNSLQ